MHAAAYNFVKAVLEDHPIPPGAAVLEIGSLDVNGSVRELFTGAAQYHGIDSRSGRGVDEQISCADYDGAGAFDLVICTEVLEHMQEPAEAVACAWRALRKGGRIILTMAAPSRAQHGVDGGALEEQEFYQNITPDMLAALLHSWRSVQSIHNAVAHDLYATAVKP
jgi:SAM-dependent methyltransferase